MLTKDTKTVLLDHARTLFYEGGLGAVNLREVARRTGVSATAVYRHFTDKSDLMRAVVAEGFARFDQALAAAPSAGPALSRLLSLAEAYWSFALVHPEDYRVLFHSRDTVGYGDLPPEIRQPEVRSFDRLVEICALLRPAAGPSVAIQVWSVLHGAASLVLAGRLEATTGEAAWRDTFERLFL